MSAHLVAAIARRILQQFRHDRRTLALLFVVPIVILSLFDVLIRGGSSEPRIDVVVSDSAPVAGQVAGALQRSSAVQATVTDLTTAERDLGDGRVVAYVVFPQGFTDRIVSTGSIAPDVHLEGTEPSQAQPVILAVSESIQATMKSYASTLGTRIPTVDTRVSYLHGGPGLDMLDYFGAAFIGLVVFFLVFVVTIVSFLRERSQGTLERLMASPLRRGDIVVGYMIGFAIIAIVQAGVVLAFTLGILHIHNEGNVALVALIALLMTLSAVNLGVLLSMFARTEFQAVQFIPMVIVPQFLLSGIIFPVTTEPQWLQYISNVLPLTYGVSGLRDVMLRGMDLTSSSILLDIGVLAGFVVLLIVGAAATLRREAA